MSDEPKFTQADLDKIKEEADTRIEAMNAKVQEALDEAKKAKAAARAASEIKPEDMAAAEERAEKAEARATEAERQVKALTTERDKAVKALETEQGFSTKMLTENALNAALAEAGVTVPGLLAGAKGMFGPQAQVITEGDQRVVKIGDKAVTDAIKEWSGTDDAKHYITAPVNGGGGAPGGKGGNSGARTMSKTDYDSTINGGDMKAISAMNEGIRKGELKIVTEAA